MKIEEFKGKKVTVMGLGLHGGGVGTARFFSEAGARVIVTDIRSKEELAPSVEKLAKFKNIEFVFNAHRPEDFTKVDMVVKSPAAPWTNKYVKMAIDNKVPVEMDSSLFFQLAKNKIIGVTGTKGKTTTATLIYEMLKGGGKEAVKVGVGQVSVLDKLKELKQDTIVVFELSSWRLSALGRSKISPSMAVVTNIYPDHLNYYKTMDEYVKDKRFICLNQKAGDFCVLNVDDRILSLWDKDIRSQVVKVSREKIFQGRSVYLDGNAIYTDDGDSVEKLIDVSEIQTKGDHNITNMLLAIAVARVFEIDHQDIRKTIMSFRGVPHRLELVREMDGVSFINDTSATTPESAMAGLSSFREPVIIICGGSDKNLNMELFGRMIAEKAKGAIFFKGKATDKLIEAIKNLNGFSDEEFKVVESMTKAVELAKREAQEGDVILLSPGAASFGIFKNEFDRGEKFREAVNNLK